MKHLYLIIYLLMWFVLFLSCAAKRIEIPEEPYGIVEYISHVKSIDRDLDFSKQLKDEKIIITDSSIYMVIKVNSIEKKRRLKWKWYDPQHKLVKASEPVTVNAKETYLEYFVAWDSLDHDLYKDKSGIWTVIVSLDDIFLITKKISIVKK